MCKFDIVLRNFYYYFALILSLHITQDLPIFPLIWCFSGIPFLYFVQSYFTNVDCALYFVSIYVKYTLFKLKKYKLLYKTCFFDTFMDTSGVENMLAVHKNRFINSYKQS